MPLKYALNTQGKVCNSLPYTHSNSTRNYLQRKPKETHKVIGGKMRLSIKRKYAQRPNVNHVAENYMN